MFTVDGVRKLHSWTHASLSLVVDHLSVLPAGDYVKEVPGLASPRCVNRRFIFSTAKGSGFTRSRGYGMPTEPLRNVRASPMRDFCRRKSASSRITICRTWPTYSSMRMQSFISLMETSLSGLQHSCFIMC